jgi:hypothetical protein
MKNDIDVNKRQKTIFWIWIREGKKSSWMTILYYVLNVPICQSIGSGNHSSNAHQALGTLFLECIG